MHCDELADKEKGQLHWRDPTTALQATTNIVEECSTQANSQRVTWNSKQDWGLTCGMEGEAGERE